MTELKTSLLAASPAGNIMIAPIASAREKLLEEQRKSEQKACEQFRYRYKPCREKRSLIKGSKVSPTLTKRLPAPLSTPTPVPQVQSCAYTA